MDSEGLQGDDFFYNSDIDSGGVSADTMTVTESQTTKSTLGSFVSKTSKNKEDEDVFGENFELLDEIKSKDKLYKSKEFQKKLRSLGPDIFQNSKLAAKVQPFKLDWVYGIDIDAQVINLIDGDHIEVFFSAAHFGVLFNYKERKMKFLEGHRNKVTSISASTKGVFLLTADTGPDNILIVWNSDISPALVYFDLYPEGVILSSAISPSGTSIVSVGTANDELQIDFRKWSEGREEADGSKRINNNYGKVIKFYFRPAIENHFALLMEKAIAFFTWNEDEKTLSDAYIPILKFTKSKLGNFAAFTYLEMCHDSFAVTSEGFVVIFGTTLFSQIFSKAKPTNENNYVKLIKISDIPLNTIDTADNFLLIGDSKGHISIFDRKFKLLYWFDHLLGMPIQLLEFNRLPRKYILTTMTTNDNVNLYFDEDDDDLNMFYRDIRGKLDIVYKDQLKTDASLWKDRWVIRNFIAVQNGQIYMFDYVKYTHQSIFDRADDDVAVIAVHEDFSYLIIAYKNGTLTLYNYGDKSLLITETLPPAHQNLTDGGTTQAIVTVLEYSPKALHLACGRSNGELWILEPVTLKPKTEPFKFSVSPIMKICFNVKNTQMACCNKKNSIYLLKFDPAESCWIFLGKTRPHYKMISELFFFTTPPDTLVSIGSDRFMVFYNNVNINIGDEFLPAHKIRIEQTAVPLAAIYYPEKHMDSTYRYILTADDQHKYKLFNEKTQMCRFVALGPAYGCYEYDPVTKISILPNTDENYIVFKTKKYFGLQKLPLDGNPYRFVGCLGHHEALIDLASSFDGQFVFTCGKNDRSVLQWKTLTKGVDLMSHLGGIDFEPYYCVIDGGKNGYLFQEMQDLFFYMQILHDGENTTLPRRVSDKLAITELPDLMRACGYYPTDYDIETLIVDIKYREFDGTGKLREDITFLDFVKLYVNHKPVYGYPLQTLEANFETFAKSAEEPIAGVIKRDDFLELLTEEGEPFTLNQIHKCTEILLAAADSNEGGLFTFHFIPTDITYKIFKDEILGIDMDRDKIEVQNDEDLSENNEDPFDLA